jgi:hypothetical protein
MVEKLQAANCLSEEGLDRLADVAALLRRTMRMYGSFSRTNAACGPNQDDWIVAELRRSPFLNARGLAQCDFDPRFDGHKVDFAAAVLRVFDTGGRLRTMQFLRRHTAADVQRVKEITDEIERGLRDELVLACRLSHGVQDSFAPPARVD